MLTQDEDYWPEPPCTCTRIDVDIYDARGCELCDPQSDWNKHERAQEKPVSNFVYPVQKTVIMTDEDTPF